MIPQYKPTIRREALAQEVSDYIKGDGWMTEHKHNEKFENTLAEYLGVKHCFTVNNGTISLALALLANGIQPGDYVLVPNITMIATCNAVRLIGAKCAFIDVDERNLCMDLEQAKEEIEKLGHYAKAVMYVTLHGRSHPENEYESFREYCESKGIALIEDNAQSLGSTWGHLRTPIRKISCPKNGIGSFSFSMPKIITTGQGGCLVTNDDNLALKIKKLKDFGRAVGGIDTHDEFGINAKFTEIQAIMGLNQMEDIEIKTVQKCLIACLYKTKLQELDRVKFIYHNSVPWFIDIYVPKRDELKDFLYMNEIHTRAIYPELTSQKVNDSCNVKTMKVSGKYCAEGLWLPSYLDITEEDITLVCNKIKEFFLHN